MNRIEKKICVVVPVYNSESIIEGLISKIKDSLKKFEDYSMVLVNDNSADNSYKKIKRLAESDEKIIAINLIKNVGQQKAIFLGLKHAKGDYIVIIDDDFAHNPDDIHLLYTEAEKGYDVVYGIDKKDNSKSLFRSLGSRIRDITFDAITNKPKQLKVCSFRIINYTTKEKIIEADKEFIYISMEILKYTINISNIYLDYLEGSKSNYSFSKLTNLILNMYIYYSNQKLFKKKTMPKDTYRIGEIVNGER